LVAERFRKRAPLVALLLAAWVALAVGAGLWGVNNSERHLADQAVEVLAASGLSVTVEISGRDAILSGDLTAADRALAIDLVSAITGIRRVEWGSPPMASDTTPTTTGPSVEPDRPSTSTTRPVGAGGSTTTDVSVLSGSEGEDAGSLEQLPETGSQFTAAFAGIVSLMAGILLVRRARDWASRDRTISERLAALQGRDGS
jgi:LPXTG-motif cell wall-anchored protein